MGRRGTAPVLFLDSLRGVAINMGILAKSSSSAGNKYK